MGEFYLLYHMKYFLRWQIVIYLLLCLPAGAQVEHWDTYLAKFGEKPGSVLVDMGLIDAAGDKRYPFLVVTGPQAQNCDKKGMPDNNEISTLEEILEATNNFLTGVTAKVLTGTFTHNCKRLNYYYVKDTAGIRNALMRMYSRGYKNYNYAINIKSDPEWNTYRTFLYPNEETLNWMENNRVMTKMLQEGDSLVGQRELKFYLSFDSVADVKAFTAFAETKGFAPVVIDPPFNKGSLGVVLTTPGYVKMETINPLTELLKKEATKHHGFFKTWSASRPGDVKTQK